MQTNHVFYFTGTGNCLMAARAIAAGMGSAELIRITGGIAPPAAPLDGRTVVVFPVYCGNAPEIVREFVAGLTIAEDGYFYAIATHGGHAVIANPQIASILNQKGMSRYKLYELEMVHNGSFVAPVPEPDAARQALNAAYARAEEIGRELTLCPVEPLPAADKIIEEVSTNPMAKKVVFSFAPNAMAEDFFLSGQCSGCGTCTKVCPMGNIALDERGPHWDKRCQLCLACLQCCPTGVIQYIHNHVPDHTTLGKGRYRNPDVSLDELTLEKRENG